MEQPVVIEVHNNLLENNSYFNSYVQNGVAVCCFNSEYRIAPQRYNCHFNRSHKDLQWRKNNEIAYDL